MSSPPPTASRERGAGSGLRAWFDRHRPEILLIALSITLPELLSGSTPVVALLNPLAVLTLVGLYGMGALVIREVARRWGRGWGAILPLGLAYGVVEEGIATRTWVDPRSKPVGFLGSYGHLAGVSWDWAAVLTVFHAVYSIALPILLVGLAFPETRERDFLSDRGLGTAFVLYLATVTFDFFAIDPGYFEGYAVLAFLIGLALALAAIARALPRGLLRASTEAPSRSPRFFLLLGGLFALVWTLFYLVVPRITPFFEITIAGEAGNAIVVLWVLRRTLGRGGNELHQTYLAAGLLLWYIPWNLVLIFGGDYLALPVLVAVYVLLYRIARAWSARGIVRRRSSGGPTPPPATGDPSP